MTTYDWIALAIFLLQYAGYHILYFNIAENKKWITRESTVRKYRKAWVEEIANSQNHIFAVQTIRNLEMLNTFLISLTMLIIGGIVSILSVNVNWLEDLDWITLVKLLKIHPIAIKLFVALTLMVIAFMSFIFSLRINYNMNFTISMSGIRKEDLSFQVEQVQRSARHFIIGIRALYHAIIPAIWILDTTLMIFTTLVSVIVLFRFDFLKGKRLTDHDTW